jgi:hypothetical protein
MLDHKPGLCRLSARFRLSTDILDGKDHNAMASWVTTFCRSSPQATIREASQQLVAALSRNEIK